MAFSFPSEVVVEFGASLFLYHRRKVCPRVSVCQRVCWCVRACLTVSVSVIVSQSPSFTRTLSLVPPGTVRVRRKSSHGLRALYRIMLS